MPLVEWIAALEGFGELHGGPRTADPLNRAELNELLKLHPDHVAA